MKWVYSVNNSAFFTSEKNAEAYLAARVKSMEPTKVTKLPHGGERRHYQGGQHLDKWPVNVAA